MATEEQTTGSATIWLHGPVNANITRAGQKLTITNRLVSKLAFKFEKRGSPTGDLTFTIRKVSDDSIVATKVRGDASAISDGAWAEVTFDSAIYINEEVRILCEYIGGSTNNDILMYAATDNPKAAEFVDIYFSETYDPRGTWDVTYIYTYTAGTAPTVTTQAVTSISGTVATGNGNVTDLGDASVTQHGHCWNTTGTPDTDDSKTENGAKATTGTFTSTMTGLTVGTKYYVRAYATSSAGTAYGTEVEFVAGESVYPTDAITRVTNLIHRYNRKEQDYSLEIALGEVTSDFGLPQWLSRPQASVPEAGVKETAEEVVKETVMESVQAAIDELMAPITKPTDTRPAGPSTITEPSIITIPLVELPQIIREAKATAALATLQAKLAVFEEAIRLRKLEDSK